MTQEEYISERLVLQGQSGSVRSPQMGTARDQFDSDMLFPMLATFGLVILYGIGGVFVGSLWTFVIGLCGAPGAFLNVWLARNSDDDSQVGMPAILVCALGQSYAALAFVAFVVAFTRSLLISKPVLTDWLLWTVAFFVALIPVSVAATDAARKRIKSVGDAAITLTLGVDLIGFFVFVFAPSIMQLAWGWVPYVG